MYLKCEYTNSEVPRNFRLPVNRYVSLQDPFSPFPSQKAHISAWDPQGTGKLFHTGFWSGIADLVQTAFIHPGAHNYWFRGRQVPEAVSTE